MKRGFGGRIPARPWTSVCTLSFPFLFSLLYGCREQIPSTPATETVNLQLHLSLNSYYGYDNWILYPDGSFIPGSKYHTSWRAVDTASVEFGYAGVTDVLDSTFASNASGTDSLAGVRHRYFRTAPNGDFFEYGFIAQLLYARDSLELDPQWDRLLSPSAGLEVYWTVESSNSPAVGTIEGRFLPQPETVEDSINGVAMGVLAYHVEITGVDLTLGIWVGGSPPAFLRISDLSDVPFNRLFQELRVRRTR